MIDVPDPPSREGAADDPAGKPHPQETPAEKDDEHEDGTGEQIVRERGDAERHEHAERRLDDAARGLREEIDAQQRERITQGDATMRVHVERLRAARDGVVVNVGGSRRIEPRSHRYVQEDVDHVLTLVVPGPTHDAVKNALRERGLVLVCGDHGTGRSTTALAALAEVCDRDSIHQVALGEGGDDLRSRLESADGRSTVLRPGAGHLLQLPQDESLRLEDLQGVAETLLSSGEPAAWLAVVGPPPVNDESSPLVVRHVPPDPMRVLERHLRVALAGSGHDHHIAAVLSHADFLQYLDSRPSCGDVARLAVRVAEALMQGRTPDETADLLDSRMREVARTLLGDVPLPGATRTQLRTMSLRVAWTVLHGFPLTSVFEAANVLRAELELSSGPREQDDVAPLFDGGVAKVLGGPELFATGPLDDSRGAELRDARLLPVLLDVLWADYDQVRPPFLRWLVELGRVDQARMRARVSAVAAYLSRADSVTVHRQVVRAWAVAPARGCRDTAAAALHAIADANPALQLRVRAQVRDWCRSRSAEVGLRLRDTAARAYRTELGRWVGPEALEDLHHLARDPGQTRFTAIPEAVTTICWPDNGPVVLAELAQWVSIETAAAHEGRQPERGPLVQAGCSLLFLRHELVDVAGDGQWPALLALSRQPEIAAHMVTLWRQALSENLTATRAWQGLVDWLVLADDRGGALADTVLDFVRRVLGGQAVLRARVLDFYLPRVWQIRYPDRPVWATLRKLIEEDRA